MRAFSKSFLLGVLLSGIASTAIAGYPNTVDGSQSVCDPQAPRNCIRPVLTSVAGTQRGLSIAAATALTIPAGATMAAIQPQGTNNTAGVCLFWQDDGTDPTAVAGMALGANATLFYVVGALPIKLIAATGATCTATIAYYK